MDQRINSELNFTYSEETQPPKDKRNQDNISQFVDPGNKGQTTIQANQSNIAELTTGVYYFCVPQKEHKIHTLHYINTVHSGLMKSWIILVLT